MPRHFNASDHQGGNASRRKFPQPVYRPILRYTIVVPACYCSCAGRGRNPLGNGCRRMFFWIYDVPAAWLALLFSVAFIAFNTIGVLLVRRYGGRWLGHTRGNNELIGYILAAIGVFYGLMLGLLAVSVYENAEESSAIVGREASALAALYRDVSSYPEPARSLLQGKLKEYTAYTIEEAWPQQRRGVVPRGNTVHAAEFQAMLDAFEPPTRGKEILHAEALHQLSNFVTLRRDRLQRVTTGLPAIVWYVLVIGAVISMAIAWCLSVEKASVHVVFTGAMAWIIGLSIFLIASLDYPFRGELGVGSDAFELVYHDVMGAPERGGE
jgi:hypothetical protein